MDESSWEATTFREQLRRELAGNTASFLDEMMNQVGEVRRLAKIQGLSLLQINQLMREKGALMANASFGRLELLESRAEIPPIAPVELANGTTSSKVGENPIRELKKELRDRAEHHVREICGNVFPGVRKLARALGCENRLASLQNAIKSSTYLKARIAERDDNRKKNERVGPLTEVHLDQVAQSTEPNPSETETLDDLIADQAADEVYFAFDGNHAAISLGRRECLALCLDGSSAAGEAPTISQFSPFAFGISASFIANDLMPQG